MPEIVLLAVKLAVLSLLWGFVLTVVMVVRRDIAGPRGSRPPALLVASPPPTPRRGRRSVARRLVVTQGALSGSSLPLGDAPVTIGRADDSTLVLTDDYVSTNHARLVPQNGEWLVEDLGSTNGTFLDRAKVTGPTSVAIGVPIRIGKTVLELRK
ncbi:MAG TPA: FHA domain-containing protein [Mycobacteriales bacterium]|nr:FHA domain-containing protein [Mycobacteriales bacterium]